MVKYGKVYPISFGLAWGLVGGFGWMFLCWFGMQWGLGLKMLTLMSDLYTGIEPTWIGGLWGFFWGFLYCFFGGMIFALIYNCSCKSFCCSEGCGSKK